MPQCKICERDGVMTIEDLCCNCFDEVDSEFNTTSLNKGNENEFSSLLSL